MPAIVKILAVFGAVLMASRVRVPLGLALVAGGVALNLWAGVGWGASAGHLGRACLDGDLWLLELITLLIMAMGRYLTAERNAGELIAAARRWGGRHGRAATLMALPAVIGLVPMPAGALMSAPFVEQAGGGQQAAPWKTAVNYWFRHIWEYWWPLYPGVIVAMSVFELDAWRFISAQVLYTPVAVAAGYFFLIHPHVSHLADDGPGDTGGSRRAARIMTPVAIVVAAVFVVPFGLEAWAPGLGLQSQKLVAVLVGLVVGLGVALGDQSPAERRGMVAGALSRKSLQVLVTLGGVLVFKFMLETSGLLPTAAGELSASGIPAVVAVAALPFLAGIVTGVAVGFTGVSFPLVVGLMHADGGTLTPLATLVLAYGFGYVGMMLSPVHLCLLMTRDYFATTLGSVMRHIWPCALSVLLYAILAHVVLRWAGW